jgi:hypothetical protein
MAEEDPQRLALIARHQNVRWTYRTSSDGPKTSRSGCGRSVSKKATGSAFGRKSGCRALILSPGHKNNDYFASLRSVAPEINAAAPARLSSKGLPNLEIVIRLRREKTSGMLNFDEVARSRSKAAPGCTACRRCSSPCSIIPNSAGSTCGPCAQASWRARPARSADRARFGHAAGDGYLAHVHALDDAPHYLAPRKGSIRY